MGRRDRQFDYWTGEVVKTAYYVVCVDVSESLLAEAYKEESLNDIGPGVFISDLEALNEDYSGFKVLGRIEVDEDGR